MDVGHDDCSLCAEIASGRPPRRFGRVPSTPRVVQMATRGWQMLPSLGPVAPRHEILVPTEHRTLSIGSDEDADVVAEMFARWRELNAARRVIAFEHANSPTGCGVVHAHVHLVTLTTPVEVEALFVGVELRPTTLSDLVGERRELFWCMDHNGRVLADAGRTFVSQFARRAVARANGVAFDTDWKEYTHEPWYRASLTMAQSLA